MSKTPKPPLKLSKNAAEKWSDVYTFFSDFTTINSADLFALCRYCERLVEWEYLNEQTAGKESAAEATSAKGTTFFQKDHNFTRIKEVEADLLKIEKLLGLSRAPGKVQNPTGEFTERNKLYRAK